jgi:hypothetical protein
MAKVILEYDSIEDARAAIDGWYWQNAMWELDQHLRSEIKYNDVVNEETKDTYDQIRKKIREILSNNNINLDL